MQCFSTVKSEPFQNFARHLCARFPRINLDDEDYPTALTWVCEPDWEAACAQEVDAEWGEPWEVCPPL